MISILALSLLVWPGAHVGAKGEDLASTRPSSDSTARLCRHYSGPTDDLEDQEMDQLAPSSRACPNQTIIYSVQGVNSSILLNKPLRLLTNCVTFIESAGPYYVET